MSFIDELRAKSADAEYTKAQVIAEIKQYFDEYLDGTGLENFLKYRIGESEIKNRKVFMKVNFWEYHEGCSGTQFHCGGKLWEHPQRTSSSYKGVELRTVDKEIGDYLAEKLVNKMRNLGFTLLSQEPKNSWLGYYETHFYFGW